MAHFAKIENNIVTQVIVVNNEVLMENGEEVEQKGIDFCQNLLGGDWLQTSYNAKFRKHFAGIGFAYNEDLNAFVPPKCHDQAVLNEEASWDCENEAHNEVI